VLETAQERQGQIRVEIENPQILKGPFENAPALSGTDEDDVELLGEEDYQILLSSRQAKQWAESLICTSLTPTQITDKA